MLLNMLTKTGIAKPLFSLNVPYVDELFPGFSPGDFALLYGSPSFISVTSLLCVRAQLPVQLGGLGSNVVYIDSGNTFRLYNISRLAKLHQLNPTVTLKRILISRAFTAYQLASLIMEKLEAVVKRFSAKLVVISDIAGFFLDNDVPSEETERIYSQMVSFLSSFAKNHQIVVIAMYLPFENSKKNKLLQEMTFSKANMVLSFLKTKIKREVSLQKHPYFILGTAKRPTENSTLNDFMARAGQATQSYSNCGRPNS